jgi:hypothetical protein
VITDAIFIKTRPSTADSVATVIALLASHCFRVRPLQNVHAPWTNLGD